MTQQHFAIVITQKTALVYAMQLLVSMLVAAYETLRGRMNQRWFARFFIPGYGLYVIVWKNSVMTLLKYISRKTGINQYSSIWWATESRPTTGVR